MNFRPYLYGQEFILACDYEPIHWITYVENPGARLLRWRLRLQDYQYKFENKQGKLNRGVKALSENPVIESSRFPSPSEEEMIHDESSPSEHSPNEGLKQVLVIHEKTGTEASKPATRSSTSQRKPEDLKDALRTSSRVLRPTRSTLSGIKLALGPETVTTRGKPPISRSTTFRPVKSKTLDAHKEPMAAVVVPKRRGRPPGSSSTASKKNPNRPNAPINTNMPNLDESCIAKRLSRHRGTKELPRKSTDRDNASSESNQSSGDESDEDSDPPVYRKSRSVLPNLELIKVGRRGDSPPKSAPSCVRPPNPWLPPLQEPYVDVVVDGACSYNGRGEPKAGVGIWFGPDHPLSVSQPAQGRQANNTAEIETAVEAAIRAQSAGIKRLRINTDSKYLVSSTTEWIPAWEKNDWKTAENKPVKNRAEFEKLKKALEPIEVIWNHVPGHSGIEGNEAADQLARNSIEEKSAAAREPCNDINEPSGSTQVLVDVPPLYTSCEESNDDNDDNGNVDMATLKKDL